MPSPSPASLTSKTFSDIACIDRSFFFFLGWRTPDVLIQFMNFPDGQSEREEWRTLLLVHSVSRKGGRNCAMRIPIYTLTSTQFPRTQRLSFLPRRAISQSSHGGKDQCRCALLSTLVWDHRVYEARMYALKSVFLSLGRSRSLSTATTCPRKGH